MDKLVETLILNQHPVKVVLRPMETLDEFISCLKRKFLNIMFTDTKGNTEVGISITESSKTADEIDNTVESITLQGECGLNFESIKVKVDLSLKDFTGFAEVTIN